MDNQAIHSKEKPLLVLKPSITNALIPELARNLFYAIIVAIVLFVISLILKSLNIIEISKDTIYYLIIVLIIIAIIPLIGKIIFLYNTKYYFFRNHVQKEFELILVKKYSLPYHQITNVTTDISLWDRLCRAGDIIVHTAEDTKKDLKLQYIKNPTEIEKGLYKMVIPKRR